MLKRTFLLFLFIAIAAEAQEVRFGEAVVVSAEGPGFCGCMPHSAYGDVFDPSLAFQRTLWRVRSGTQPSSIAFGPDGNLYASERTDSQYGIVRYDAGGVRIGPFGDFFANYPSALAFDSRGNLIVAQQWAGYGAPIEHTFIRFDAAGRRIGAIDVPQLTTVVDFDIAADGCTAVVTSFPLIGTVDLCASAPAFVPLPLAPFGTFYGVRFLPTGHILVSNAEPSYGVGQLQELDRDGRLVRNFPGSDPFMRINLDPDGRSFLAAGSLMIARYSLDGRRLFGPAQVPHGAWINATAVRGEWRAATSPFPHHHRAGGK